MKNVNILSVFIGSTSDLAVERNAVAKAIMKAGNRLSREAINLAPVMWETDAISEGRKYPQESINIRLLDQCDVFVFIFHIRVGVVVIVFFGYLVLFTPYDIRNLRALVMFLVLFLFYLSLGTAYAWYKCRAGRF